MLEQYIKHNFQEFYRVTVGMDYYHKSFEQEKEIIELKIWDTCGSEDRIKQYSLMIKIHIV